MRPATWLLSACLYLSARLVLATEEVGIFENTNILRTIELGGSLTEVTTAYTVRVLTEGSHTYTFALSDAEETRTSWLEANIKGYKLPLKVQKHGFNPRSHAFLYSVTLPPAAKGDTVNLVLHTTQTHAITPLPASVKQADPQSFTYNAEALILSPYHTVAQRTKFKAPTPKIHDFTIPEKLANSQFLSTGAHAATKTGATVTYGPFNNVPPSTNVPFQQTEQQVVTIHYDFDHPVLTVVDLKRTAEISHWGANLNIQDNIVLRNDGPKLKGQFSRLEHQQSQFYQKPSPQVLRSLTMHLPAGVHSPYYYDLIGNVSTSRFRPTPSPRSKTAPIKWSVLELRPRYPVLGGWNYTFTLGWDAPLADWASYDKTNGVYIAAIPFWTPIPSATVDDAEVQVILPEGATNVTYVTPFDVDSVENSVHVTYLDTVGRPSLTFRKFGLTDRHSGTIYVTYQVPFSAHLKKPTAVATVAFGLFVLAALIRRIDPRIHVDKPKKA